MNAVQCACGRRIERETNHPSIEDLRTPLHSPDECSRNIGYQGRIDGRREMAWYQGRIDGRREMAIAAVAHLINRRSLSAPEVCEIRDNLLQMVTSLPLEEVRR